MVATTANAKNRELVMSLGADQFVDYSEDRFGQVVEPCDLVFDVVGGDTLERSFQVAITGWPCGLDQWRRTDGFAEANHVDFEHFFMSPNGDQLAQIAALVEAGTVQPIIERDSAR